LAVSLRQAFLLEAQRKDRGLNIPNLNDESILIFRKSKKTRDKWESRIMEQYQDKVKNAFEVSKQQCKLVLALSFYDLEELVEIQPEAGSCYVLSASEPFNEEMEIDFERLVNWLGHYGLPQYHVHVSGHIMPLQLRALLTEMGAEKIFPVYTENRIIRQIHAGPKKRSDANRERKGIQNLLLLTQGLSYFLNASRNANGFLGYSPS
jgi:mRNA degradation ribonuclease J1/J2